MCETEQVYTAFDTSVAEAAGYIWHICVTQQLESWKLREQFFPVTWSNIPHWSQATMTPSIVYRGVHNVWTDRLWTTKTLRNQMTWSNVVVKCPTTTRLWHLQEYKEAVLDIRSYGFAMSHRPSARTSTTLPTTSPHFISYTSSRNPANIISPYLLVTVSPR